MSFYIKNNTFQNTLMLMHDVALKADFIDHTNRASVIYHEQKIVSLNLFNVPNDVFNAFRFSYASVDNHQTNVLNNYFKTINLQDFYTKKVVEFIPEAKLLTANVLSVSKYQKSDNLFLADVQADKEYQILTNIDKLKVGSNVAIALNGSLLPNGKVVTYDKVANFQGQAIFTGARTLGIDKDQVPYKPKLETGEEIKIKWQIFKN